MTENFTFTECSSNVKKSVQDSRLENIRLFTILAASTWKSRRASSRITENCTISLPRYNLSVLTRIVGAILRARGAGLAKIVSSGRITERERERERERDVHTLWQRKSLAVDDEAQVGNLLSGENYHNGSEQKHGPKRPPLRSKTARTRCMLSRHLPLARVHARHRRRG